MSEENELLKGFTGSAGANMIFVVAFILYRTIQGRCQKSKSKCATHLGWCDIEIENDDSSSENGSIKNKHEDTRITVSQLHEGIDLELSQGDTKAITFDTSRLRAPEEWFLANREEAKRRIRKALLVEETEPKRRRAESV